MWDKSQWHAVVLKATNQLVHLKVSRGNQVPWLLTTIYGSLHYAQRGQLWEDLQNLAALINGPWALMGDYNAILNNHERRRAVDNPCRRGMLAFRRAIQECELIDAGFQGYPLT